MKKRKRSNRKRIIRKAKRILYNIANIIAVIIIIFIAVDFFKHYEKYDSVSRYYLMLDLENGNDEALEYYKDKYISDDIYLFDGDISFDLFAEKYNIEGEEKEMVKQDYKNSGLSLNGYVREYKKA